MRIKIEVTQEDINYGIKGICDSCPVARAIKRKVKDHGVSVGSNYIRVWGKEIQTLKKVSEFIRKFDTAKTVKPFSFCINLKEGTL